MGLLSKHLTKQLNTCVERISERIADYAVRPGKDFTRSRKLDATRLMQSLMSMGGNTLKKEIHDLFKKSDERMTASAFVQQRDKLKPAAFRDLLNDFNRHCEDKRKWNGYRLVAVDGTVMNIARDPESNTFLPKFGEKGINQLHVTTLFDVPNKTYMDVEIQPQPEVNEQAACLDMVARTLGGEKTILLADRGFGGFNLIETLNRKQNVDYVIRVRDKIWREIADLPMEPFDMDFSVEIRTTQTNEDKVLYKLKKAHHLAGPSKFGKEKKHEYWQFGNHVLFRTRIVRVKLPNGAYETLVTSLSREEATPAMLTELYHLRWDIETSYRELKYAIGVTSFHARKIDSIVQEIYARIIMYNYCERITLSVAVAKKEKNILLYKINYVMAIYIVMTYFRRTIGGEDPPDPEPDIGKHLSAYRPGRSDERNLKPKSVVPFIYRVA